MGKSKRTRLEKTCDGCAENAPLLYRVKTGTNSAWMFLCKPCQLKAADKSNYQYGGTWKREKRN